MPLRRVIHGLIADRLDEHSRRDPHCVCHGRGLRNDQPSAPGPGQSLGTLVQGFSALVSEGMPRAFPSTKLIWGTA